MEERDYKKYDYMSVAVKTVVECALFDCYDMRRCEITGAEDKPKGGMVYKTLRRPHDIPHRDVRQFLQVRVESESNYIARLLNRCHMKSMAFCITLTLLTLVFLALGTLALCLGLMSGAVLYSYFISSYALAALFLAGDIAGTCVLRKRERTHLIYSLAEHFKALKQITNRIRLFVGDENGQS